MRQFWRGLWSLAAAVGVAGPVTAQEKAADKLSPEVRSKVEAATKEYEKRGAQVYVGEVGGAAFLTIGFPDETTDKQLAGLPEPPVPCAINLTRCRITDASVRLLAGFKTLRHLDLATNGVTRECVPDVAKMAGLVSLNLFGMQLTAADLKELQKLEKLETLEMFYTPVTDAMLKELIGFKKLESVNLRETKVTAAGLKTLKGLKTLDTLTIGGPEVTDAWVDDLAALDTIDTLIITFDSKITPVAMERLKAALKGKCRVVD